MARVLPRGRVTFAFVDVVGSTRAFAEHGDAFVTALAVLHERVSRHTTEAGGVVVKTEGDGAFLAFPTAQGAVDGLVALQTELARTATEPAPRLQVRAGAHSGEAVPVGNDYVALAVNVAARVTSAAGAGQVVTSATTQADLIAPAGVPVGTYALRDVADPLELWRVCGDDAPLRAPLARRTNVRTPVSGFFGRAEELAELRALVADHALVTVLGPGGLGKTRLASELVLEIATDIEGGAWLVELASLERADQVPAAVAQVFGLAGGDAGAIAAEVRRRGRVLLVLDNCEHVIGAVADLVDALLGALAETAPCLTVLCTSREPLQLAGEVVWRLSPLAGSAARVALFSERARTSGAVLREERAAVVDRLCTALDGLPLAIELAATQAGSTSLEELIRIAEHGTDDLARRGGTYRQRSLDAVLAWSLDALPPARRASLLVLSVVPGRFDLDMAATILAATDGCDPEAVRPLARASLIDLDGEDYRILDTIRHAARRHLAAEPALAAAARLGLRAWALQEAAALYRERTDFYEDVPVDRLLALETALEQAMDDGVPGLGRLWELVRLVSAVGEASDRLVRLARRVLSDDLPADADEDLSFACAHHVLLGADPAAAPDARMEEICAAADQHELNFGSGCLHYRLAMTYATGGDVAAAQRHVAAYLPYAASPAADDVDRWYTHLLVSVVARAGGHTEEALAHADRFLAEADRSSHLSLGTAEGNLAETLLDLGRPAEALPHALEAVRLCPSPGPHRRFLVTQVARAHAQLGHEEAARAAVREFEADLLASGSPAERSRAEREELRRQVGLVS